MNIKKIVLISALCLGWGASVQASSSRPAEGFSVIVAPANIIVMQIAFDISDQKPCVLVSYEPDGNAADPFLHVWNKARWVPLSFENYQSGTFIKRRPSQVIVLGPDDALTERLLTASESWGPQSFVVPVDNARNVINGLGQRFQFNMYEWRWFAERYELELIEINADEREKVWYDQPNYFKGGAVIPPIERNPPPRVKTPAPPPAPPPSTGSTTKLEVNPAVTRATPATLPTPRAASTLPPVTSGRVTTLPSIEQPAAAKQTVVTSGTVNGQPAIKDEVVTDPGFKGWKEGTSVTPTPNK